MRRIKASQARDYFQERVKTCNKTLVDMVDIVRRHPGEFTAEDVRKVQGYLSAQVTATVRALAIATTTAVRTEFDFDMELPIQKPDPHHETTVFPPRDMTVVTAPAEARSAAPVQKTTLTVVTDERGVPMREKPAGRLFGTDEVVKELVPLVPQRKPRKPEDPKTVPDAKHGGIEEAGFVED